MYTLLMGVQDFVQLRQNNLLYLDKITRLLELIENGRRYFLLRPCRFGKSFTFSTLDARFYGTENGTLRHYPASPSTRGNCVYVPQGNSLISGTIRYNLLLGKTDATEEEMHKALYAAAAEFVMKDFPDGLDTLVGESGIGISEGQAQRIAIARSLLCSGNVILMDEPTSALDAETERIFLMRLTEQLNNKTIIVVTHKKEICKYVSDVITIKLLRE